ncbi:antibiotic biosynthesis monooxygenase [Pseudoflavitalea sp. X16]|uniref:putative quinol monooxygenase n=1 Tax=Paraflavitalea devenefica TaxID=2716334 RepID=UPI001420995E|nr:antibiotic biosynthesis monooxygenase [Paraflavitalea devenefica]NII27646.1 antibiotic biosynthesis monooxygenase [Paraflavitalea devenefica]
MKKRTNAHRYNLLLVLILLFTSFSNNAVAQDNKPYVRIAKILIDSAQLESYNAALKEHAEAAVSKEPGVRTLYAVYDKEHPTHVTVFEIYASLAAYQSHIQTPHFLKYKSTVKNMVKSLELTDVIPIALEAKLK